MKTIELTEEQYQALTNGEAITIQPPKPKITKWQPSGGEWGIRSDGYVIISPSLKEYREFGTEYQTKEQAEWASDKMRSFNRQLAWLVENDDGWKADWNDESQHKYYAYLANDGLYYISYNIDYKTLGAVYMSEANAYKLCKLLNEGVVEL